MQIVNHQNSILPVFVTLGLLVTLGLARSSETGGPDAEAHHRRVREAVAAIPQQIGDWVGEDKPITQAAIELLQPNALLKRDYRHTESGQVVTLLIVHCGDARDMLGHYPPVCYPAHGWEQTDAELDSWSAAGGALPCREYAFEFASLERSGRIAVVNLIVLPDGRIETEMEELADLSIDSATRHLGAGQIQLIFDASLPRSARRQAFDQIMSEVAGAIDAMSGASTHD